MKRFVVLLAVLIVIIGPVYAYMKWNKTMQPTVKYGARTEDGILTSTGISLIRRGTHVLTMTGGLQFFVQSNVVELDQFSEQRVRLKGQLEPNVTTEYLPLFVVTSLEQLDPPDAEELWSVPALGLTVSAPQSWKVTITSGVLMFEFPDVPTPLLIIKRFAGTIPPGVQASVGSKSATRVVAPDLLKQDIYVPGSSGAILLTFTPPLSESGVLRTAFDHLLTTVRFTIATSSAPVTSGSGLITCGGAVGILCPTGLYCDIVDSVTSVGVCRKP